MGSYFSIKDKVKRIMALTLVVCMVAQTSVSAFATTTGTKPSEGGTANSSTQGTGTTTITPTPTSTVPPTSTPAPTETPKATESPAPTGSPAPTETPVKPEPTPTAQPVIPEPPVVEKPVPDEAVPPLDDKAQAEADKILKDLENNKPLIPVAPGVSSLSSDERKKIVGNTYDNINSEEMETINAWRKKDKEMREDLKARNDWTYGDPEKFVLTQEIIDTLPKSGARGLEEVSGIRKFSASNHVLVYTKNNKLYGWGDNSRNQLFNTAERVISKPTEITFFRDKPPIVSLLAGNEYSIVLTADNAFWVAGNLSQTIVDWTPLVNKPENITKLYNASMKTANRGSLIAETGSPVSTYWIQTDFYETPYLHYTTINASKALSRAYDSVRQINTDFGYEFHTYDGSHAYTNSDRNTISIGNTYYGNPGNDPHRYENSCVFSMVTTEFGQIRPGALIMPDARPYVQSGDNYPVHYRERAVSLKNPQYSSSIAYNNGLSVNNHTNREWLLSLAGVAQGANEFMCNATGFRINPDNTVSVAGENTYGKAGIGDVVTQDVNETVISSLTGKNIKYIHGDMDTVYFLSQSGELYASGSNRMGQLGQGDNYYETESSVPVKIELGAGTSTKTVSVTQSAGGTILANPTSAVPGTTITVSASPSTGYELVAGSLKYNGIPIAGNTFVMPNENVNITAQFARRVHAIQVYASPNGTVSVNRSSAAPGETVTVTVTPNNGFRLRAGSLKYNSIPMSGNSFSMPDGPTTVSAEFERTPYQILVTQAANGTIQSSVYSTYPGDTVNLLITPNTGFGLKANSLKMNGVAVAGTGFVMPNGNATVTAEFEASAYSIAVHPAPNGSVSVDKPSAKPGEIVTVTASANPGFALKQNGITLNNSPITGTSFTMPMYSVSVTAQFEPVYYNITIGQSPNGSVTTNKSMAVINEGVMVSAIPNPGYKLKDGGITVNGTAIAGNNFSMPNNHCTVAAQFEPILFNVVVNNAKEGTISVNKTQAYTGDMVSVEAFPSEGYRVRTGSLKYDNISITTGQFRMPANDAIVTCEYDVIYNDIVVLPPPNGLLTASKDSALLGDTIIVNSVPDRGYRSGQGGVLANGIPISGNSFLMPLAPVTLTTQFQPIPYNITVQESTRGKIVATKTQGVINELIELSIIPNDGYQVKANSLRVNGVIREQNNFVMPAANVLVTVDFEPIQYPIDIPTSVGGVTKTDRQTAKIGDLVKIQTTPAVGYQLNESTLRVNGNPIAVKQFIMTPQDTRVEADYDAIDYAVKATPSDNGHIFLSKSTANINDNITLTVKPDDGYRLVDGSLRMNGMSLTGTSFVMPAGDVTVTASFETIQYAINVPSVQNGRISASSTTSTIGSGIRVTVLPNTGYKLKDNSLTVDGIAIKNGEFKMPAKSVQLAVEFEPIVYKVTKVTANNGKVATDKTSAIMNEKVTITTTPAEGYKVIAGSIRVNGVSNYGTSFMMPAEDALVSAEFEPVVYTVKVTQSEHGTVTVDKPNATIGQDVLIKVKPEKGYKVSDASLQVNGEIVKDNKFKMPAKTVEVTVKYERVVYDITLTTPENGTAAISKLQANYDNEITVTMKPALGYIIGNSTLKLNGIAISGNTFRMPDKDSIVTVEFESVTYNTSPAYFNGGRVSFDKPYAHVGEEVTVVLEPDSGYKFVDGTLRINGDVLTSLKFKMPARNVKPDARFEPSLVQGLVTDASNNAVNGIEVVLESAFYSEKTQSAANGSFRFKLVPDGRFKLKTNDYTWQNATTDVEIKNGVVTTTPKPVLIVNRDSSVQDVEELIEKLPPQTSSMSTVQNASGAIQVAKIGYDLLNTEQKAKVNSLLKDKLRILFAKVTPIEVEVLSSLEDVTVTDVALSINKEQYITLETSPKDRISMQVFLNPIQAPTVDEELLVKEKINQNESVLSYLDIKVLQKIGTNDPLTIDQLNKPITVTVGIQDKETGAKYKVVRLHDDEATILPSTIKDSKITFKTDKFSTYAIVTNGKAVNAPPLVNNDETLYWEGIIRKIQNAGPWDVLNEDISAQKVVPTAVIQTINDWTGEMHFVWDVEAFMLTGKEPVQIQEQKMFFSVPELLELCKKKPVIEQPIVEQPMAPGFDGMMKEPDYDSIFGRMSTEIEHSVSKALPNGLFSFMTGNKEMSPLDTMMFVFLFTLFVIVISVTVIFLTPVAKLAGVRLADDFNRKLKKKRKKSNKLTTAGTGRLKNSMSAITSAGESFKEMLISKNREKKPKKPLLERFKGGVKVPEVAEVLSVEDEVTEASEVSTVKEVVELQPIISEEDTPNYEASVKMPKKYVSEETTQEASLGDWLEELDKQEVEPQIDTDGDNSTDATVPPEI